MSSIANLGGVLNAIFPPKIVQDFYSTLLRDQQDKSTAQIGINRDLNSAALSNYTKNAAAAADQLKSFNPEDIGLYGGMARRLAASDPIGMRKQLADQNSTILADAVKKLGDQSTLQDKLSSMRMGGGGAGPSTYTSNLASDRAAKNLMPMFSSLYGNLTGDVSNLSGVRRADYGAADAAINARAAVPTRALALDLAPIDARNSALSNEQALIGQGIGNIRADTSGFHEKKNKWAAATQEIDKSLNSAIDAYLSMYTGGMAGGGGNSDGGSKGGSSGSWMNMLSSMGGGSKDGSKGGSWMDMLGSIMGSGGKSSGGATGGIGAYQAPGGKSGYLSDNSLESMSNTYIPKNRGGYEITNNLPSSFIPGYYGSPDAVQNLPSSFTPGYYGSPDAVKNLGGNYGGN